jgi:hypothetical protein
VRVGKSDVSKGQLLVSAAHHCGLLLNWELIDAETMFASDCLLGRESVKGTFVKMKTYEPVDYGLTIELYLKMKQVTHENFTHIAHALKLK